MAKLPVVTTPLHDITIPSTGKTVKFRPFKVKEEKLLLMAMESGKLAEIVSAISQIIINCTDGSLDPNKMSSFDIEWLFLKLRTVSKGERQHLEFPCQRPVVGLNDDGEEVVVVDDETGEPLKCGKTIRTMINLNDATIDPIEKGANKVMVSPTVGIVLRYPGFDLFSKNNFTEMLEGDSETSATEMLMQMVISNIDSIFQTDTGAVFDAADYSTEDLVAFIDDLPDTAFEKIKDFFTKMPKVRMKVSYSCSCNGGKKVEEEVEGIQNFLR